MLEQKLLVWANLQAKNAQSWHQVVLAPTPSLKRALHNKMGTYGLG